jgi:hypothetical protein
MNQARRWIAAVLVAGLAVVVVNAAGGLFIRVSVAHALLVVAGALAVTAIGLAARRSWGRSLGLAAGVACSLYAGLVITFAIMDRRLAGLTDAAVLFVGPVLLACLSGSRMYQFFGATPAQAVDRDARLARWTVIANLAGLASLVLGSGVLYRRDGAASQPALHLFVSAVAVLLPGVLLLARQKTAGLLLVTVACLIQLASLVSLFVADGYGSLGGLAMTLVTGVFLLPGMLTSLALTLRYARPICRLLRS